MIVYLMTTLGDRRDENRARELRSRFGRAGWLLSWDRLGPHRWLARLSCPRLSETVEEIGRDRCEAIAMAEFVLRQALLRQDAGNPKPGAIHDRTSTE